MKGKEAGRRRRWMDGGTDVRVNTGMDGWLDKTAPTLLAFCFSVPGL